MAHRCRICSEPHFSSRAAITFPWPAKLAAIDAVMPSLLEAAREFEAWGDYEHFGPGTPLEFLDWLIVETRGAALVTGSHKVGAA